MKNILQVLRLSTLVVVIVTATLAAGFYSGQRWSTGVALALSDDWSSCLQDQTSDGEDPESSSSGFAVWDAEWDMCTDCTNNGPSAGNHGLTINVDEHDFNCPSLPLQSLLAQLFIQFCAPMTSLNPAAVLGSVVWKDSSNRTLATTDLVYSYSVTGLDPYSVAESEVTCLSGAISESAPPVEMIVQWNTASGGTSPAKGNAPRGWELHVTCCDL